VFGRFPSVSTRGWNVNDTRHHSAHQLATATPQETGFSAAGLDRLTAIMQREVDSAHVPGAAMLIARGGKLAYRREVGALRPGGPALPSDALFRIYSMTKPIVSVALMMLVEEGRLFVNDPLAKFIPAFADPKVGVERDGKLDLVPAERAITIQDLLRHTSGLTYAFTGNSAVQRLYGASQLFAPDPTNAPEPLLRDLTTAEFAVELAKLPLIDQPGASWYYSHSTDILGRVIEVVSGQSLGTFLRDRILAPLGMHDTSFLLTDDKYDRVAEPFAVDPDNGKSVRLIDKKNRQKFEAGGGGLWSTMDDYFRFALMLHGRGTLGQVRIISRKTLDYMTADQLGPDVRNANPNLLQPGHRFGLGFSVRLEAGRAFTAGTPGEFSWGGMAGTIFWIAPKEELVAIQMTQAPGQRDYFRQLFRNLVHAALL
jgi:CubicO group peptidase (beta-lactamase class C family)